MMGRYVVSQEPDLTMQKPQKEHFDRSSYHLFHRTRL